MSKANYAILSVENQLLYVELHKKRPVNLLSDEKLLENVTYQINDGILEVTGDEITFDMLMFEDRVVEQTDIDRYANPRFTKIPFTSIKFMKPGWYELKERTLVTFTTNVFVIAD